ncbi:paraquat-inducible protein A [Colwellia chukchiensis]|uniref:Paraquat-inducible protein A n=1 Tax=Colwellia chukchiensis TaxID=641665 RepID=A0A1H7SLH3_9GAMM|nr:paraquat-inducible protein A [Colwellia chukchiensis]SEL73462.1 paraquat-inducible protein A [Colwellia chukchiensis]
MQSINQPMNEVQCHECALMVKLPNLKENQKAQCPRCACTLSAHHRNAEARIIAFAISALIFLLASLPFNFLSFRSKGLENDFELINSIFILIDINYHLLALIELLTIFAIPSIVLLAVIYLLTPLHKGLYPKHGRKVLSLIFKLLPWCMGEIFLIGALVSLIKITAMADISLGMSFYAFVFFSIAMTLVTLHLDKQQLTQLLINAEKSQQIEVQDSQYKVAQEEPVSHSLSVQKTWALLFTALILYIPANAFPIMSTHLFGQDEPSTIIGGVSLLWQLGSYPIAVIIFIASVIIPIAKILVLAWLNYSVQKQSDRLSLERVKWYRLAEFVGRWSMIDVFVVIVLVSLIQLGPTMSIMPGGATLAFSGVVIFTMLAAMSFEPKLIWKNNESYE